MNRVFQHLTVSVLTLFLFSTAVKAQEQPGLRERANQLYASYEYAKAAPIYLKLTKNKKPKLSDMEHLADCYLKMNDYETSESWYARIIRNPKSTVENLINYGEVLKANARYAEAKEVFLQYASKTGNREKVAVNIAGCDSAIVWVATPQAYELKNELAINSPLSEFSAFPYQNQVYYVAEPQDSLVNAIYGWTGKPYLRIYTSAYNKGGNLSNPAIFGTSINNEAFHVGPLAVNKAGNTFYVTRTYAAKNAEISQDKKYRFQTSNLELYIYTKNTDTGNLTAKPFAHNDVRNYSVGHAALSPDEKTLYFVSDMPGGFGGTDIWFCKLEANGQWGQPYNAGSHINSGGNEMFPNVSPDGTLFYSSDGLAGMGGLDIFKAKGSRNSWSEALNLRYPVNSAADDFSFVVSDVTPDVLSGYFSSNRSGGKGADDIYSFRKITTKEESKRNVFAVSGTASNKTTREILPDVNISLFKDDGQLVTKQKSDAGGNFYFELEKGTDYKVLGQKVKFYGDYKRISTKNLNQADTMIVTLSLDPLYEIGKTIALQDIHYDLDKDNVRPDAVKILDELAGTMHDNPTLEIELASHTDSRGSDSYNLDLSQRRAQAVVNFLVSKGISRSRMVAKGYGETQLLNRCADGVKCPEADHQVNRRTEFKILKF